MAADREILFGLLALQNGLVGRDDLVTAFQIWMKDKTQTLAQILQQRTSGLPAEFELLQRLVELHITKHGQDPQQSLASLSSLDSVINELQQLGNADIEATFMQIGQDQRSQPRVAADVDPGKKNVCFWHTRRDTVWNFTAEIAVPHSATSCPWWSRRSFRCSGRRAQP
jgi:hypothetical protein